MAPRGIVGAVLVLTLLSCADEKKPEPAVGPVVEVDGRPFTVADLATYLRSNLEDPAPDDPPPPGQINRVKSRLFDNFVDEAIQLVEAERLGVTVLDEEIDAYLGDDIAPDETDVASEPRRREAIRKGLMVQKLREHYARRTARVTDAEIGAYLAELDEEAPRLVTLRTLRANTHDDAMRARLAILRGKVSFEEAADKYGVGSDGGVAMEVLPETMPPEVRRVIEKLRPGQLSVPLEFRGSFYLFALKPAAGSEPIETPWARARQVLLEEKYMEASSRLLAELKEESEVRVYTENLPFPYVAEKE